MDAKSPDYFVISLFLIVILVRLYRNQPPRMSVFNMNVRISIFTLFLFLKFLIGIYILLYYHIQHTYPPGDDVIIFSICMEMTKLMDSRLS